MFIKTTICPPCVIASCVFLLLVTSTTTTATVTAVQSSCSSVTSFNTALLNLVPQAETRRPHIAPGLRDTGSDVLCLQEVWLESDMRPLVESLQDTYPYHYSAIHYRQGDIRKPTSEMGWTEYFKYKASVFSPCTASDHVTLMSLMACALREGCVSKMSESGLLGTQCITQQCRTITKSLSQECVSCVVLQGGSLAGCSPNPFNSLNAMNRPGLVLMSKTPMTSPQYVEYFPDNEMVTERGYLEADISGVGKVVCTHMTALFDVYYEYDLHFDNFTVQQAEEFATLTRHLAGADHLLMGDLNTGPQVAGEGERDLDGEGEVNFLRLTGQYAYQAPYFSQDGRCTYCTDNPLLGNTTNKVIDHILVKGQSQSVTNIERTLDTMLPSGVPVSDHYGVKAEVCTSD